LAMLFNLCLAHSYLPKSLMRTVVVPIIKNKTGDSSDKNNYRPISLATITAKVLDSVINSKLTRKLNLIDAQFGFRADLSTESAILSLKHTVRYYTKRRTSVYACFLDLSKAFDLVAYDLLWNKLGDAGVPTDLVSILKFWYSNQTNQVRWAGTLSDEYRVECGVRQGGISSPLLFNLYINQLIERLSSTHVGCYIDGICFNNISYADDMVLLGPSISAVRTLLSICENYAEEHGLKYNSKKSEILVFKTQKTQKRSPTHVPPVFLNGVALKMVDRFKYLGHIVTSDLRDDEDIERERRALAVRGNMLARRFARSTVEVKTTLFKAYCQSFYSSGLWVDYTQRAINALQVQYNNVFRMLLGLPRHCSASGMFAEARTDGFKAIIRKKSASLMQRLRGSTNSLLKAMAVTPSPRRKMYICILSPLYHLEARAIYNCVYFRHTLTPHSLLCGRSHSSTLTGWSVGVKVRKGMLRWFGHVERMHDERMNKQIYNAKVDGCRKTRTNARIMVDDVMLEQVNEFVYFGCAFSRDGRYTADIERRVNLGNSVNGALGKLLGAKNLSQKAQLAIHNAVLVPTLTALPPGCGLLSRLFRQAARPRETVFFLRSCTDMVTLRTTFYQIAELLLLVPLLSVGLLLWRNV
ncbi:hypothetical protein K1T71_012607, partial [Dendrolimus kikuchii]